MAEIDVRKGGDAAGASVVGASVSRVNVAGVIAAGAIERLPVDQRTALESMLLGKSVW